MCFSAGASFGIGTALVVTGVITLKNVKERKQIPFALIPMIFALQQFFEGVVWLSIANKSMFWLDIGAYSFLFFAQIFWPFWIPFSVYFMEKKPQRKKIMLFLLVLSVIDVLFLFNGLVQYTLVTLVSDYHIVYKLLGKHELYQYNYIVYIICVVIPLFLSSVKTMYVLAVLIAASALVSLLLFDDYFISVWCFFAAGISVVIYFILRRSRI